MGSLLLGLDIGSTVTKASIFDTKGKEIVSFGRKATVRKPKPGWYERDMDEIWASCVEAVRLCMDQVKDPASVIAVSMTGHGNGLHLVDEAGDAVRPAIEGADARAAEYVAKWMEDGTFEAVHPLTMQVPWPAMSASVLAWMKDHEPESLEKAQWYLDAKDFVRFKMTGQANVDITSFSGTGLLNVKERKVDPKIFEMLGMEGLEKLIPPLADSAEVCGRVTSAAAEAMGLKEGIPVAAGMYDIDAAAVSTGVIDQSKMNVIAGTWCNNQYVSDAPIEDKGFFSTSVFAREGFYLMLEGSPTSASNLEWFVTEMLQTERQLAETQGTDVFEICNKGVAETTADESDIVFLPFLYGSNAGPAAKSAFIGIQGWHERKHIIRAVYEGICFSHRWHIEKLLNYRDKPEAMRFAGGASRSEVWLQMFADILQTPIEVTASDELGTLGAAICAAVGAEVFEDFGQGCEQMVHIDRKVMPDKALADVYTAKYERYKKAIQCLDGFWA